MFEFLFGDDNLHQVRSQNKILPCHHDTQLCKICDETEYLLQEHMLVGCLRAWLPAIMREAYQMQSWFFKKKARVPSFVQTRVFVSFWILETPTHGGEKDSLAGDFILFAFRTNRFLFFMFHLYDMPCVHNSSIRKHGVREFTVFLTVWADDSFSTTSRWAAQE